jgi:DNA invertase Pin-like site-specific DNA recombinase
LGVFGAILTLKLIMIYAFAYLRLSGLGQLKGDGFTRQLDTIKKYAKANRIEISAEFRDKVSGTKDTLNRDGLTELFAAIRANGVRLVLCENPDRLARDLMVSEIILAEFRKLGVKVIAADSGTDLTVEDDEPTKKLIRQILAAFSEFDKSRIVQKLRAARLRKRKAGERCEGRKPYGVTPEETANLELMKQLHESGISIEGIAKHFNEQNIPTRTKMRAGKIAKWHANTIQKILARV